MQNPTPTFKRIFAGTLTVDSAHFPNGVPNGPHGRRILIPIGGTLNDPETNEVIAECFPGMGTDTGLVSPYKKDGKPVFYLTADMGFKCLEDGKFIYLRLQGIGELGVQSTAYARIETDSEKYDYLNGEFLVFNVRFMGYHAEKAITGIYGLDSKMPLLSATSEVTEAVEAVNIA